MTISKLGWYFNLKEELTKYSIPVDDVSELTRLIKKHTYTHMNYDANKVINEFWSIEQLRINYDTLQKTIYALIKEIKDTVMTVMNAIHVLLNRIGPDDDIMLAANLLVACVALAG